MERINFYSVKQVKEKSGLYHLNSKKVSSPEDANQIIQTVLDLNNEAVEKFGILTLDSRNVVAGIHVLAIGTLNAVLIHPREVFKAAILNNAAGIVLFHNHPSGDPTPSEEDIEITQRIVEAGHLMMIEVLDHIITGDGKYCSMAEQGLLNRGQSEPEK
ncbi:JAB domain-containing protein [Paenibacillus tyrfis]|uniref:JAB domain-containing protein n=1 Tax=Paenibacillus tyrfis TaxID=1501230 RepID=UPI002164F9FA|nr:DNA repair protein RadC [Paenibacillus tyrfis]